MELSRIENAYPTKENILRLVVQLHKNGIYIFLRNNANNSYIFFEGIINKINDPQAIKLILESNATLKLTGKEKEIAKNRFYYLQELFPFLINIERNLKKWEAVEKNK